MEISKKKKKKEAGKINCHESKGKLKCKPKDVSENIDGRYILHPTCGAFIAV